MARQQKERVAPAGSPAKAVRAVKAKYPQFRAHFQMSSSSSKRGGNHANNLKDLISQICDNESSVITSWVDENPLVQQELEGKGILSSLRSVLSFLPKAVATQTATDVQFHPEIPSKDRAELRALQSQYQQLVLLNGSIEKLFDGYELAFSELPTNNAVEVSKDVDEALTNYKDILDRMDSCCNAVLELAADVNKQLFTARQIQDQLYDKCNEKRSKLADAKGKDARELIRGLPKYIGKS